MTKKLRYENPLAGARESDSRAVEEIADSTKLIREALNQAIDSGDSEGIKWMMILSKMHNQGRERDSMCMSVTNKVYVDMNDIADDVQELKDRNSIKQIWNGAKLLGEAARIIVVLGAVWVMMRGGA